MTDDEKRLIETTLNAVSANSFYVGDDGQLKPQLTFFVGPVTERELSTLFDEWTRLREKAKQEEAT